MSRLDLLAETTKLARLLGVSESELGYLNKLDAGALRKLREAINAAVFDDTRPMLQRIAAASKLLPAPAIALIGEKVFGPLLCGLVSGLLPTERALDLALRMPDSFLAEVAVQLDPRSAREVIGRMPASRVAAVAAILVQRGDWITMGRFVDYLSRDTIKAVIADIRDEALLHVAFYVENRARLNDIATLLPAARLRSLVVLAGAEGSNLWAEALSLMGHLEPGLLRRIGDLAADQDETVLTRMLRTAQAQNLWDSLLPVIAGMSESSRQRLARLPALAEREILQAVIGAADREGLWDSLLPLVSQMGEPARRAAAQVVEHLSEDILQRLFEAVQRGELWSDLIALVDLMDKTERRSIARLIGQQGEELLGRLLRSTHQRGLWPALMPLLATMPQDQLTRLNQLAGRLGLDWKA